MHDHAAERDEARARLWAQLETPTENIALAVHLCRIRSRGRDGVELPAWLLDKLTTGYRGRRSDRLDTADHRETADFVRWWAVEEYRRGGLSLRKALEAARAELESCEGLPKLSSEGIRAAHARVAKRLKSDPRIYGLPLP